MKKKERQQILIRNRITNCKKMRDRYRAAFFFFKSFKLDFNFLILFLPLPYLNEPPHLCLLTLLSPRADYFPGWMSFIPLAVEVWARLHSALCQLWGTNVLRLWPWLTGCPFRPPRDGTHWHHESASCLLLHTPWDPLAWLRILSLIFKLHLIIVYCSQVHGHIWL